jgi:hypothetical protein
VRKLIAFDDDTFDKLKQLGREPDGDRSGTGRRSVRRSAQEARHPGRPEGCASQERIARQDTGQDTAGKQRKIYFIEETEIMTTDPDPFEEGQRAARENIPVEGNPYQDGSQEHALWAAGHEDAAGEIEADESERH